MIYRITPEMKDIQDRCMETSGSDENIHDASLKRAIDERLSREKNFEPDSKQSRINCADTIEFLRQEFSKPLNEIDAVFLASCIAARSYDSKQHNGEINNFFSEGYAYFTASEKRDENFRALGVTAGVGGMFNNGFITFIFTNMLRQGDVGEDMMLILSARLMCAHFLCKTINDGTTLSETFSNIEAAMNKFFTRGGKERGDREEIRKTEGMFDTAMVISNYLISSQIFLRQKENSNQMLSSFAEYTKRMTDRQRLETVKSLFELIYRMNRWGDTKTIGDDFDMTNNKDDHSEEKKIAEKRINNIMSRFSDTRPGNDDVRSMLNEVLGEI